MFLAWVMQATEFSTHNKRRLKPPFVILWLYHYSNKAFMKKLLSSIFLLIYFLIVVYYPLIVVHVFFNNIIELEPAGWTDLVCITFITAIFSITLLKFQWILICLPYFTKSISIKSSPLFKVYTNLSIASIVLGISILIDTFLYKYFISSNLPVYYSKNFYIFYTSFTSNIVIIFIIALIHDLRQKFSGNW